VPTGLPFDEVRQIQMVEIKQAVDAATQHLTALYSNPRGVQLEEVYLSDDESAWLVTLSFLAQADEEEIFAGPYGVVAQYRTELLGKKRLVRIYKSFEVDGEKGTVRSMKIRPIPSV
jgi:hypothetical protein